MKGLMICVLATIEVLGVIYVMANRRRDVQVEVQGLDGNTTPVGMWTDVEGRKWFLDKGAYIGTG